jgi:hypothetical protein
MRNRSIGILAVAICVTAVAARGQNDWQSPDPYFGVFQHRQAATPEAERKYRAEIAPQQPHRLHEQREHHAHRGQQPPAWRPRTARYRQRAMSGR